MAICGNCGAEGTRVRSRFAEGVQLPDECPACSPQSFEKFSDPSDRKIWIAPEIRPQDYRKVYDKDGLIYMPKPEVTAELEQQACGVNSVAAVEERQAMQVALEEKRRTRRTRPMTQAEHEHAIAIVDRLFRPLIEDPETAYDA